MSNEEYMDGYLSYRLFGLCQQRVMTPASTVVIHIYHSYMLHAFISTLFHLTARFRTIGQSVIVQMVEVSTSALRLS